jgi:twitching motility two-component system response regulator PilH
MLGLCGSKKATRQSRILVVDNEADSESSIQQWLRRNDWEVACTTHEKEAVQEAIQERPALILLDPMTQSVNNYDTLRLIKQNPQLKDIPVVMCTGSSEGGHRSGGPGSGHALMIVKANAKSCHVISHRLLCTLLHLVEQQDCLLL